MLRRAACEALLGVRFDIHISASWRPATPAAVATAASTPTAWQSVIALARALNLSTAGEGIETSSQQEHLRALGCDAGQGYLFARPAPAREIEALLASTAQLPRAARAGSQPNSLPNSPTASGTTSISTIKTIKAVSRDETR